MTDPIKDLSDLKNLFPEMESYIPDPDEKNEDDKAPLITAKEMAQMKLYVSRDKKQRGGKQVTIIQGRDGAEEVQTQLLSKLKSMCSAGGTLKDGEIIIQGDHVKKVMDYLIKSGYKLTKQKGG